MAVHKPNPRQYTATISKVTVLHVKGQNIEASISRTFLHPSARDLVLSCPRIARLIVVARAGSLVSASNRCC